MLVCLGRHDFSVDSERISIDQTNSTIRAGKEEKVDMMAFYVDLVCRGSCCDLVFMFLSTWLHPSLVCAFPHATPNACCTLGRP